MNAAPLLLVSAIATTAFALPWEAPSADPTSATEFTTIDKARVARGDALDEELDAKITANRAEIAAARMTIVATPPAAEQPVVQQLGQAGSVETYCDANPNSFGTVALIDCVGSFDVREKTFGLRVVGAPPVNASFGMFTCGQAQTSVPFGNGYLCISPFSPGIFRMPMQSLGGAQVMRTMVDHDKDFYMCEPGSAWNFQFWYRNPAAGAVTFNTSNAIHVQFAP